MKVAKIGHAFVKLQRIVITKVSLFLQINGKQNTTFQFLVKIICNKMHEATFKLVLIHRQYVDTLILRCCYKLLMDSWEFSNVEKHFIKSKML